MLNQKIKPIRTGGIPGYNRIINDIIAAVNWLQGIRTINGPAISETITGPVITFPTRQATSGGATALSDAETSEGVSIINDPGGVLKRVKASSAGVTVADSGGTEVAIDLGAPKTTPDGQPAGWVQHQVCINGTPVNKWFWGQTT
jgi:hypothetical protein